MVTERDAFGLKKEIPDPFSHLNKDQFGLPQRTAPVEDEPFEPLSDEDYEELYNRHEASEAAGRAERQRIGNMKRQAHRPPPEPKQPKPNPMTSVRYFNKLASNVRGKRRW